MTPEEIYDILPLSEHTLLKRYKSYPFKIANDRGRACAWYIYEGDKPVAVVIYYKGRKLVLHRIEDSPCSEVQMTIRSFDLAAELPEEKEA